MENLCLLVGLGNPGRRYASTRHNAGFMVVDRWAMRWRAKWSLEKKFAARIAWAQAGSNRVLLAKPQTYMNNSGEAVSLVKAFYKLPISRLLVVVDDADLPLGELRLRPQGGSGGHHGLESIEAHLSTRHFARLRVGIGRSESEAREITDYVLAKFDPDERDRVDKVVDRAADQLDCWLREGLAQAMNQFNGVITN